MNKSISLVMLVMLLMLALLCGCNHSSTKTTSASSTVCSEKTTSIVEKIQPTTTTFSTRGLKTSKRVTSRVITSKTSDWIVHSDGGTRKIDAWVCAQDIVNSELKAPSTAKFCSYPTANVTWNGGSDYTIKAYVDAENGFGTKIRTYFTVTLTLTAKGYKNGYVTFN